MCGGHCPMPSDRGSQVGTGVPVATDRPLARRMSAQSYDPAGAPEKIQTADPDRRDKIAVAAKGWTGQLVAVTGRNTLLFYKDLRQGTLDISVAAGAVGGAVLDLLASRIVRLSNLFPDPAALGPAAKRARTIRAKA